MSARSFEVCPDPIFVIGSPRSGTTALGHALGTHSRIWASVESDFLFGLFGRQHIETTYLRTLDRPGGGWLGAAGVDLREFAEYVGLGVNALYTSRSGGRRWIDQTPLYTVMASTLARLFPGARFVHLLRDGRMVVNSMINFHRAPGVVAAGIEPAFIGPWASDFREAAATWARYVGSALRFESDFPGRCLTVANEALSSAPEDGFRAILDFLGESYENGPAEFFSARRLNSSFAADNRDGRFRHPVEDPWRTWTEEQRQIFCEEAAETSAGVGYPDPRSLLRLRR